MGRYKLQRHINDIMQTKRDVFEELVKNISRRESMYLCM